MNVKFRNNLIRQHSQSQIKKQLRKKSIIDPYQIQKSNKNEQEPENKIANQKTKDKYLRRVDKYGDYINKFTLNFYNQNYENEWRIRDINERKIQVIMIFILKILGDCLWQWGKGSLWNQIQQGVFDIVMLVCLILMYKDNLFCGKLVIDSKQSAQNFENDEITQNIQNSKNQKKANRMYYSYFIFFFIWIQERVPTQYDTYIFSNKEDPDFINKYKSSILNLIYFDTLNFSINVVTVMMADINWIPFNFTLLLFSISQFVYSYIYFYEIFTNQMIAQLMMQFAICLNNYNNIKTSKINFLQDKKIKSLLKQQVKIFQNLPDGAIVYGQVLNEKEKEQNQENESSNQLKIVPQDQAQIEIRYMNVTFKNMFNLQRLNAKENVPPEILQSFNPKNNIKPKADDEKIEGKEKKEKVKDSIQNLFIDQDTDNLSFMEQVYFQKTNIKIGEDCINQQGKIQDFAPLKFIESIQHFENGQVYKVLTTNNEGQFQPINNLKNAHLVQKIQNYLNCSNQNEDFLVYIVSQEILFEEEISTIIYFRDISFGIVQDQIKKKSEFQNYIFRQINKFGDSLNTIIINCKQIENSQSLQSFESADQQPNQLKYQLKQMRVFSDLISCRLKDMRDYQDFRNEIFIKSNKKFDLETCFNDIKEICKIKSKLKNLDLIISPTIFERNDEKLKNLLKKYKAVDKFINIIPCELLGDKDRLKQIIINLVMNSIDATYQGTITIDCKYNFQQQQIRFTFKDTGIGIKPNDLSQIKNIIQQDEGIDYDLQHMLSVEGQGFMFGLTICKLLVTKYNGKLFFKSKFNKGSTFGFIMDMRHLESNPQFRTTINQVEIQDVQEIPNDYQKCIIFKNSNTNDIIQQQKVQQSFSFKGTFQQQSNESIKSPEFDIKQDDQIEIEQKQNLTEDIENVGNITRQIKQQNSFKNEIDINLSIQNQEETVRMFEI